MSVKTALVVDDSRSSRFALRKFLELNGCMVDTAESADEAFTYLRNKQPDVVFLDHLMPGTDGFDALKRIRTDASLGGMPVIICSSNEGPDFVNEARAEGALGVLPKPPTAEDIASALHRVAEYTSNPPLLPETASFGSVDFNLSMEPEAYAAPVPDPEPAPLSFHEPAPAVMAPVAAPVMAPVTPAAALNLQASKVQPIRTPEATIERAVLKTLREALPLNNPAQATPAAAVQDRPAESLARLNEPAMRQAPVRHEGLRDEVEVRLRRITQDLFVQLAEMKAQISYVQGAVESRTERFVVREELDALADHFDGLNARIDAVHAYTDTCVQRLRGEFDAMLQAQSEQMDKLGQQLVQAATEEAHKIAERVVMSAASRISDQMAESFLRVLKTPAASGQN